MPPVKRFLSLLLSLARLLRVKSAAATAGVLRAIGSNFCACQSASDLSVGMTTATGPLAQSMMLPSQLLATCVPPPCEDFIRTIMRAGESSESWSMISTRCGVREFFHSPGSADDSSDRMTFCCAHSETSGDGFGAIAAAAAFRAMIWASVMALMCDALSTSGTRPWQR